jgi:predicted nucleic acid-binding Zn ribbon protein
MSLYRRSPRLLSVALEGAERRWAPATQLAAIQSAWPRAVGPSVVEQASPCAHRAGVLTVSCSSAVWAQELSLSSDLILQRLSELVPGVPLVQLRCICDGQERRFAPEHEPPLR